MTRKSILFVVALIFLFGMFTGVSMVCAEPQRIFFAMQADDLPVQKAVAFFFTAPWGCDTYRLEKGYPIFGNPGTWQYYAPGQEVPGGLIRFVATQDVEVDIRGDYDRYASGFEEYMHYWDPSLLIKNSWESFNIGLPPRNGEDGSYDYSYDVISLGWGSSVRLSRAADICEMNGTAVAIIVFNGSGYPKRVVLYEDRRLIDEWVSPGDIAFVIFYEGNNWSKDKRDFVKQVKIANRILKEQ